MSNRSFLKLYFNQTVVAAVAAHECRKGSSGNGNFKSGRDIITHIIVPLNINVVWFTRFRGK